MHTDSPIPQHLIRRAILWLATLLSWMSGVMLQHARMSTRHRRQRGGWTLRKVSDLVGNVMMARALDLLPDTFPTAFPYWRRGFNDFHAHFRRTVLGARLRRALYHKDPAICIARLLHVLRNFETYAVELAYRVCHRLTRLLSALLTAAPATLLLGPPAPSPVIADSS